MCVCVCKCVYDDRLGRLREWQRSLASTILCSLGFLGNSIQKLADNEGCYVHYTESQNLQKAGLGDGAVSVQTEDLAQIPRALSASV